MARRTLAWVSGTLLVLGFLGMIMRFIEWDVGTRNDALAPYGLTALGMAGLAVLVCKPK